MKDFFIRLITVVAGGAGAAYLAINDSPFLGFLALVFTLLIGSIPLGKDGVNINVGPGLTQRDLDNIAEYTADRIQKEFVCYGTTDRDEEDDHGYIDKPA